MIELKENEELIEFKNIEDKMKKLKEWEIISPKAKEIKEIKYKGIYTNAECICEVVGYILKFTNDKCIDMSYETTVIKIEDKFHKISPAHLKEMQLKGFKNN